MSGQLEEMIANIRELAGFGERAAPDVADVVMADLQRSIGAGTTPTGEKWQDTRDGKRPLVNAANALHVAAIGGTVWIRLTGPEARHHLGTARGGIAREIIPTNKLPDRMAGEIRCVLDRHFDEAIRG